MASGIEHKYPAESRLRMELLGAIANDRNTIVVSVYAHNENGSKPFSVRGFADVALVVASPDLKLSISRGHTMLATEGEAWAFAKALFEQLSAAAAAFALNAGGGAGPASAPPAPPSKNNVS